MTISVVQPGTHTTVQDLGRPTCRRDGVPNGGAVDRLAISIANWLVGNDEDVATIECSLVGPTLRCSNDAVVVLCGARVAGAPMWQPFRVQRGQTISLARMEAGAYAYLAVAGGIDVPPALGSCSTDTRLGIGGIEGRPLRAGDVLRVGRSSSRAIDFNARVEPSAWYDLPHTLRIVRGSEFDSFEESPLSAPFKVTARSDRMGVRLAGTPLTRSTNEELASHVVVPGTIQIPPDGQPIILLADAQTMGGYPKMGHVIQADLHKAAQLGPGAIVHFVEVTLNQAHSLARRRARELGFLRTRLLERLSG